MQTNFQQTPATPGSKSLPESSTTRNDEQPWKPSLKRASSPCSYLVRRERDPEGHGMSSVKPPPFQGYLWELRQAYRPALITY